MAKFNYLKNQDILEKQFFDFIDDLDDEMKGKFACHVWDADEIYDENGYQTTALIARCMIGASGELKIAIVSDEGHPSGKIHRQKVGDFEITFVIYSNKFKEIVSTIKKYF